MTLAWIDKLTWIGTDELRRAPRKIWKVADNDPEVAGYIKTANQNRLFLSVIRNAGHFVSYDQPRATLDLLQRFFAAQSK